MEIKRNVAKRILYKCFCIDFRDVKYIEQSEDSIIIKYDKHNDSLECLYSNIKINVYEYGVLLKEVIEDYAKSLHLSAVWIDLNNLSKDETYYFKHCYEVYEQLAQYDLIMESEEL